MRRQKKGGQIFDGPAIPNSKPFAFASMIAMRMAERRLGTIGSGSHCRLAASYRPGKSRGIIRGVSSSPKTYAVVLKSTQKPVGSTGIMFSKTGSAPLGETERETGDWAGVSYWSRGVIPEAAGEFFIRCFVDLCLSDA